MATPPDPSPYRANRIEIELVIVLSFGFDAVFLF
jgi:hypothetical protein